MTLDFPVNIERKTVGVSERGFGTILIFDNTEEKAFQYITNEDVKDLKAESKLYKIASTLFMQKPNPQQVAVVGKAGKTIDGIKQVLAENSDWFFLCTTDNTVETIKAVSELCQIENKAYGVTVNSLEDAKKLTKEVYDNTFVLYSDTEDNYIAEALAVEMSYNIGGKTAKFKQLEGVEPVNISLTDLNELHKGNIQSYVTKLGVAQTTEGKMLSGEYIDVVLGEYWVRFRMEEAMQRLALTQDKIPYTNKGIAMIVGEVTKVLVRAVEQGIVEEKQYKVEYKLREDVPSNEVALRKYNYVKWTAMLQGAIHTGQISGVLTYDIVNEEAE